jgi:hypothetical protein
MKPVNAFTVIALSASAAVFAASASAAPIIWNTTSNVISSSYGNTVSYSSGGVNLGLSGYSTTGSANTLQSGCLDGFGSYGAGVVSRAEDGSPSPSCDTGQPNHAADNYGSVDGFLLSFSSAVQLTNIKTGWVQNDSDFSVLYYTGVVAPAMNSSLTNMLSSGWSLLQNVNGGSSGYTDYSLASNASTVSSYWYISSYSSSFGGQLDSGDDYFKLKSVSAERAVPEPGTLALLGLGLAGIGFARRRRA